MKQTITLLIFLTMTLFVAPSRAAVIVAPTTEMTTAVTAEDVLAMDRSDFEAVLGRRLKFSERIAFNSAKRKMVRQLNNLDQDTTTEGNGMAIAGFVCGVVGLFVAGIILGPLAIVFSAIGLTKSTKEGRPLKGLAIAGLVCGIVGAVGALIIISSL